MLGHLLLNILLKHVSLAIRTLDKRFLHNVRQIKLNYFIPNCQRKITIFDINNSTIVTKNSVPKIMGIWESSSISNTTKSIGIKNLQTLIGTSLRIPIRYLIDRSASYKEIVIDFNSPISNFFDIDNSIKLTLSPMSYSAFLKLVVPITHGMENYPSPWALDATCYGWERLHLLVKVVHKVTLFHWWCLTNEIP